MKLKKIVYNPRFSKKLNKYSSKGQKTIIDKIKIFWEKPFSPTLKTHKLTGKLKDFWSFSVSYNLRVMFIFSKKNVVEFIDIGSHEIYK